MKNDDDSLAIVPNKNLNKRSRAAQFIDFDQDGDDDIYIANYFLEEDEFYENDGAVNFIRRLTPIDSLALQSETNKEGYFNHGTGIHWSDYDTDGDFDFILSQLAHPNNINDFGHLGTTIFENIDGRWYESNENAGIQYEESHAGTSFGDLNNDGLDDLIITAYYDCRFLEVYMQKADNSFDLKTYESGLNKIASVEDICLVDFNNDGKLDVCFINNGKVRLFENRINTNNNWSKIRLRGNTVNSYGIGAVVKLFCGEDTYTKHLYSGKGQSIQSPIILHFGLSNHKEIDKIEIYWNKDKKQVLSKVAVNQLIEIIED